MRSEKSLLKKEIVDKFNNFSSFVLMKYSKLTANAANNFRRDVKQLGGDVKVVRKRILRKAAEDAGLDLAFTTLEGHVGVVFLGEEPIEVAKYMFKFKKDQGDVLDVLGGKVEGENYGGADIEKLSKLPSRDEMRAELLGLFEAPMAQTLAVFEALLTSVPHCLENKQKKDNGESDS